MKAHFSCLLLSAFVFATISSASALTLSYGSGTAQVAFLNQTTHPEPEGGDPSGPRAFRVHQGEFWVADSVAGRVLHLSNDGTLLHCIDLGKPDAFIEDLALSLDHSGKVHGVWVVRGDIQEVALYSLDGSCQRVVGSQGDAPGAFLQASFVEVSRMGHVVVADHLRQRLCIFHPDGGLSRELHWEWSGFTLDPADHVARLSWNSRTRRSHVIVETLAGEPLRNIPLELQEHTNPKLWWTGPGGESLVTFIPSDGFEGEYGWAECDGKGRVMSSGLVKPPVVMGRFLARDRDGVWYLGAADYSQAPQGELRIEPVEIR